MARPKKAGVELRCIEDCEIAMRGLLEAEADLAAGLAERDLAVAKAQAMFETRIDEARDRAGKIEAALKDYYYAHREQIEADGRKHLQLANGVMGRRDNPPALVPRTKHITWRVIGEAVKGIFGMDYFHPPAERKLDKDKLKGLSAEQLARVDLRLETGETFCVEPARLPVEISR